MLWKFTAKLFYEYNKQNPTLAFFNIIFIIASVVSAYYLPKYYGFLFELFNKDINKFLTAILYILILDGLVYAISEFEEYYLTIQSNKIEELTNKIIMDKIRDQFLENPEEVIIGEKIAILNQFKDSLGLWFQYLIHYILPYIISIVIFVSYLSKYDYILPIMVVVFLISSFILLTSNAQLCNTKCVNSTNSFLLKYQELEDYLSNLLTIHTYNEFESEDNKLYKYSREYVVSNYYIEQCTLKWCLIGICGIIVFLFLLMYRSYTLLNKGVLDKSTFLSIYFVVMSLVQSLIYLNDILQRTNKEYTALNVIEQKSKLNLFTPTVKKDLSIIDGPMKIETDSFIKLDNINFKYNSSNTNIIQNLSIDVKKGERIALVGDIGTGKSTILKIILGLVKPTKGNIYLNGKNYNAIEQMDIFKNFGYMTQNPVLFNRSILDNILFGNEGATREDVIKLLEKFGLNVVFNRLEKGIDTLVGKNGSKLSGGQRQVVWFLRIYLHNPDILLMDEPTASLSKESKEQLWKLIKEGFSDKTIIMASHDDYLIKLATRKVNISGFKQNES